MTSSLKALFEQYDEEMAGTEMDLGIHAKLLEFMKNNCEANEQSMAAMQKSTERTEKELKCLDEKTNELVQSANAQSEKIEKLQCAQQKVANGINDARHCFCAAQQTARDDLEKLRSTGQEARKFFENNISSTTNVAGVVLRLRGYQRTFCAQVQKSIEHLTSVMSLTEEADNLDDLEKAVNELRIEAKTLEEQMADADVECSVLHEKIAKLRAEEDEEKERREAISKKYKQRKKRAAELTRSLNNRQNDKKFLSDHVNAKTKELSERRESLKEKNSSAEVLQTKVDMVKENLEKLENKLGLEREKHEQQVREIKEEGEADICSAKSILITVREKKSAKIIEIEKVRDDLNKRSELEAHKKVSEEMERNLGQLKEEKAELHCALNEKESRRDAQLSAMQTMKTAFQESQLEASKKREFLIGEVKRISEEILETKRKTEEEIRRQKAKIDAAARELHAASNKDNDSSTRTVTKKKGKSSKNCVRAAAQQSVTKGSASIGQPAMTQGEARQASQVPKLDKEKTGEKRIKMEKAEEEGIAACKVDPPKPLPSKEKTATNELNSVFVLTKEIRNPFLQCSALGRGRGMQMQGSQLSQPTVTYEAVKYNLVKKAASMSSALPDEPGPSNSGHQSMTRKKREPKTGMTAHTMALALFDSDMSTSTIKPISASTPLSQKKDESALIRVNASKGGRKKRGRPKGKKAVSGTVAENVGSKTAKKKDVFDLDSDFD